MIEWMHNIPRLITDNESNIQEECETLFLELVLDRISRAGSSGSAPKLPASHDSDVQEKSFDRQIEVLFPEGVLSLIREVCHGDVTPWVKKICANLGQKNLLRPKISMALQNIIKSSESLWLSHSMPIEKWTAPLGAWFLLAEVSIFLPKSVEWEFLQHHWEILDNNGDGVEIRSSLVHGDQFEEQDGLESNSVTWAGDRVFLLQTISNVALELPHEPAAELAHNLLQRIEGFNMHSTEVNNLTTSFSYTCSTFSLSFFINAIPFIWFFNFTIGMFEWSHRLSLRHMENKVGWLPVYRIVGNRNYRSELSFSFSSKKCFSRLKIRLITKFW